MALWTAVCNWKMIVLLWITGLRSATLINSYQLWAGSRLMKVFVCLTVNDLPIYHQLLRNSCSRLIGVWELRKLSCKLSLLNSNQLWASQILMRVLVRLTGNIQPTLINSHSTLVLVWLGHESWQNFHTNSRLPTLINSNLTGILETFSSLPYTVNGPLL
jgi:hypothetical protein